MVPSEETSRSYLMVEICVVGAWNFTCEKIFNAIPASARRVGSHVQVFAVASSPVVPRFLHCFVCARGGRVNIIVEKVVKVITREPLLVLRRHHRERKGVVVRARPSHDHSLVGPQLGVPDPGLRPPERFVERCLHPRAPLGEQPRVSVNYWSQLDAKQHPHPRESQPSCAKEGTTFTTSHCCVLCQ